MIELLVVIGIIAVLASFLMPVMARVRAQGLQTGCTAHLQQLGLAFRMYTSADNNQGNRFPRAAVAAPAQDDYIYYQPGRNLQQSVIAPYMRQPVSPDDFRCPSDNLDKRFYSGANLFLYSYSMNLWMSEISMFAVKNPSTKVLLYEEDENTIDDGHADPLPGPTMDLVAIRHDKNRKLPDNPNTGLTLNGDCRGNALFCDGHVEYVRRVDLHNSLAILPAP